MKLEKTKEYLEKQSIESLKEILHYMYISIYDVEDNLMNNLMDDIENFIKEKDKFFSIDEMLKDYYK